MIIRTPAQSDEKLHDSLGDETPTTYCEYTQLKYKYTIPYGVGREKDSSLIFWSGGAFGT